MTADADRYRNYIPFPFWSLDQRVWYDYVAALRGDERDVLRCYPFKWAFAPPHNGVSAVAFLDDIGVRPTSLGSDDIEQQMAALPAFEELEARGTVQFRVAGPNETPAAGFRMIPEWETMSGVLINWPTFYPPLWETFGDMLKALDHTTVVLRVGPGYLGAAAMAWLQARGVDLEKVRPVPGPVGDIWMRDCSAIYGVSRYTGEAVAHKFTFAAFYPEYRDICGPIVDVDDRFVWAEGFDVRRTPIKLDGGYVLTDGNGTYVLTRRALTDNRYIPNLYAQLERWLGARRLIIIDEEPGDLLGHLNHIKFVGPDKILIGWPDDERSPLFKYYSGLHEQFARYGYEAIRVPCPVGLTRTLPDGQHTVHGLYANSLMVNGRVLVCQYNLEDTDRQALAAYQKALPDWTLMPIDCSVLANGGGAINCSTKEIPAVG